MQEYQIDQNSPQLDYTFIVIVRDSMLVQEWKLNEKYLIVALSLWNQVKCIKNAAEMERL